MLCLVAINSDEKNSIDYQYLGRIDFGPVNITIGTIELEQPSFDSGDPSNREYVLLRVNAFSCNYRDKALLLENYNLIKRLDHPYVPFGSEFSANVIAIGKDVHDFQVGDRVMSNCSYPESGVEAVLPGVATNFASLGWLRLHRKKLIKTPNTLSDIEAACFSLGSQTAAGMIRRSRILVDGGNPIVLSARSVTSLFIIQQLVSYQFYPLCLSTTAWSEPEIKKIYPARVEQIDHGIALNDPIRNNVTHAFDPFFDMNIGRALHYLQTDGTYITCGLRDQHPLLSNDTPNNVEPIVRGALGQSIVKNVSLLGNCLGTTEDLERAIQLQNITKMSPIIDREYKLSQGINFMQRSFFDFNRFGKCVLVYENQ